jgi:hypothetical protein
MIKDDNSKITLPTTRQYSAYHLQRNTAIKSGEILNQLGDNLSRWNLLHTFN